MGKVGIHFILVIEGALGLMFGIACLFAAILLFRKLPNYEEVSFLVGAALGLTGFVLAVLHVVYCHKPGKCSFKEKLTH
jgi:hypothetical protein